jgi:D-alanyl-D-alanine carboxypeptidase
MRLRPVLRAGLLACAIAILAIGPIAPASAQIGSERYAAIVIDARSGQTLVAANPDETRHPASLTKMMTLYMVFEALRDGRLRLDSRLPFSEEAASRPPSKLGIPAGQSISVEQAILALVTRSANDVAAAVAEKLGGSEAAFARMMTLRARALGMSRTTFRNASGLPDPDQVTTARDMATLGRRLFQDFPDRYHYFGVSHAQLGGVRLRNHNRMLESYEGVDGIKTGFINASGFNIVTSANRGGQRLIGAVFGGASWTERDAHMASLLDRGFEQLGVTARAEPRGPTLLRSASAAPLPQAARPPARRVAAARAGQRQPARQAQLRRVPRPAARPARLASRPARTQPVRAAQAQRIPSALGTPGRTASPTLAPPVPRGTGTVRTAGLR